MGNLVYYRTAEHALGDVAKGRWVQMRRLLPALVDYLNEAMQRNWVTEARCNLAVPRPLCSAPTTRVAPPRRPFSLDALLQDRSETVDDIYIKDASLVAPTKLG